MATTKFYLDMRGKAKDGRGSVVIILAHNQTTTSFSTGVRLLPSQWNGSSAIKIEGREAINASLVQKKQQIDKELAIIALEERFHSMTASQLKATIDNPKKRYRHDSCGVRELFEEYISLGMKKNTETIYRLTLKKVVDFGGPNITINDIDYKWLLQFDKYLAKTQCINGRSIYLRSLRAVYNYALKIEVTQNYPFRLFSIKAEPTKKRSIFVEKLHLLHSFPTDKECSMYRDYFFLMFYLIGINVGDLLLAKKSQVRNGRLEYIRQKTGKPYSIKIEPEAEEILKRYRGKGQYLLNAMDHCQHYQSFARQINEGLRAIGPEKVEYISKSDDLFDVPEKRVTIDSIIPGITTYYARHTWATIAHEIGIQTDVISQALGHSFGNRTTLIYINLDPSKVDEANRKVIDYFNLST